MSFIKLVVSGIPPDSRLPVSCLRPNALILTLDVNFQVKLFILTLDAFLAVGYDVWLFALAIFLRNSLIFLPLWKIKNSTVTEVSCREKA